MFDQSTINFILQISNMYPKLKEVIILSGFNEIFLSRYSQNTNYFGPFTSQIYFVWLWTNLHKRKIL